MIHTRWALLLLAAAATSAKASELISLDLELRLGQHTMALYRLAVQPGGEAQVTLATDDRQPPQTLTVSATPRDGATGEIDLRATLSREDAPALQGQGPVLHNVPTLLPLGNEAAPPREDAVIRVVAFIEDDGFGDWPPPADGDSEAPAAPRVAAVEPPANEAEAERSAFAPEP